MRRAPTPSPVPVCSAYARLSTTSSDVRAGYTALHASVSSTLGDDAALLEGLVILSLRPLQPAHKRGSCMPVVHFFMLSLIHAHRVA